MPHIRKAVGGDIAAIHDLGEHVPEFLVNDQTVNFWPQELLADAVASDDVLILVAEEDGIVGFLIINYNHGLRKALIENIYVTPAARGQGVGRQLLDEMVACLRAMGCEYVAALVQPDATEALSLYEANGFSRGESFVWLDMPLDSAFDRNVG